MDINEYGVYASGVLVHNNFKQKINGCYPEDIKEDLWENFKLLVKIANEENNSEE